MRNLFFGGWGFLLILLSSCSGVGNKYLPASEEDAQALALVWEKDVKLSLGEFTERYFDYEAFAERCFGVGTFNEKELGEVAGKLRSRGMISSKFEQEYRNDIHYLGNKVRDGKQHILFRMTSGGGVNYIELMLAKPANHPEETRICDLYIYTSGCYLSQNVSEVMGMEDGKSTLGELQKRLTGKLGVIKKTDVSLLQKINTLMSKGKNAEALAEWEKLSEDMKKKKSVLMMLVQISGELDSVSYNKALERYFSIYPNDPSSVLLSLDLYFYTKEYEKIFRGIDQIESELGRKDSFLQFLKSSLWYSMEEMDSAYACARLATEIEPGMEDAWRMALLSSAARKDYPVSLHYAQVLFDSFMVFPDELEDDNRLQQFVNSPESGFQEWKKSVQTEE